MMHTIPSRKFVVGSILVSLFAVSTAGAEQIGRAVIGRLDEGVPRTLPVVGYVRTTTGRAMPPCPEPHKELFWKRAEIPYVISASTADAPAEKVVGTVNTSFQTWQDIEESYIGFEYDGVMPGLGEDYDGINVVTWIEDRWPGKIQEIALTILKFSCTTGEIYDADIILNGEHHRFNADPSPMSGTDDVQNTVTHEVGHFIGFDHDFDPQSTMYAEAGTGEITKRDLTQEDIKGVIAVYPKGSEPDEPGCDCSITRTSRVPGGSTIFGLFLVLAWFSRRSATR